MTTPKRVICPSCDSIIRLRPDRDDSVELECPRCGEEIPIVTGRRPSSVDYEEATPVPQERTSYAGLLIGVIGGLFGMGCLVALVGVIFYLTGNNDGAGQNVVPNQVVAANDNPAPAEPPSALDNNSTEALQPAPESPVDVMPAQPEAAPLTPDPEPAPAEPDPPVEPKPDPAPAQQPPPAEPNPKPADVPPVVPQPKPAAPNIVAEAGPEIVGGDVVPHVQYEWKPGSKHVYTFRVTSDRGDTVSTTSGLCTYTVGKAGDGAGAPAVKEGSGTGFVVGADGWIMTCAHVVENATEIEVHLGGQKYPAKVVAKNPKQDVAILRINAHGLPVLPIADSASVELAQEVRAIGYPFSDVLGTGVKVTTGTVSGILTEESGKRFQVDAAINPGNSGGPVVDDRGRVVGVASAKLTGRIVSRVGFAVPSNQVRELMGHQGVEVTTSDDAEPLDGPELVKQVSPSVAYITVRVGPSSTNRFNVGFSGNFSTRQSIKRQPGRFNPRMMRPSFPDMTSDRGTLSVSEFGDVHQFDGEGQLPLVLGPVGLLIVEKLDSHGLKKWTHETTQKISRIKRSGGSPLGRIRSPRIRMPFGGSPFDPFAEQEEVLATYEAVERVVYEVGAEADGKIILKKSFELITQDDPDEPYLHITGEGEIIFDKTIGVPRSMTYTGMLKQNADNVAIKLPIEVSYRRKTEQELHDEQRLTVDEIATLIEDLNSNDQKRFLPALSKISGKIADPPVEELAEALVPYLKHENRAFRSTAAKCLETWAMESTIPALLETVTDEWPIARHSAMKALANLKAEQTIDAIAERLLELQDRSAASTALKTFGSLAEEAVVKQLDAEDWQARLEATRILKEIGTEKSRSRLKKASNDDSNILVRQTAKSAEESIGERAAE